MKTFVALTATLLLTAGVRPAHADELDEDFAVWTGWFATADLLPAAPTPTFWLDVHGRRDAPGAASIVRPAVGGQLLPWLSAFGGYAWVASFPDPQQDRSDEHRAWWQFTLSWSSGPWSLQSRTRFEHRFSDRGDDVGHRLREFIRVAWFASDVPVGAVLSNEVFFGLNETDFGQDAGYDQNRLFLGPVFRVAPWARVEAGYLLTHLNRDVDRLVHTVALNLFFQWRPPPN